MKHFNSYEGKEWREEDYIYVLAYEPLQTTNWIDEPTDDGTQIPVLSNNQSKAACSHAYQVCPH